MRSAMFCEHANEVPMTCRCPEDCYCQTHTCRPAPAVEDDQDAWDGWEPTEEDFERFKRMFAGKRTNPLDPPTDYATLRSILELAVEQAASGKGKERHASEGEAFEDQQIVKLNEWLGSTHGAIFQACKKAIESTRLPPERAQAEILGAIVYLAAAYLVIERQ